MKLVKAMVGLSALLGGACGDGGADPAAHLDGVAVVSGRLEAGAQGQGEASATLLSVDDEGGLVAVATGQVAADGRFEITSDGSHAGPLVVRIEQMAEGTAGIIGQVIVPSGVEPGDEVTTAPIGHETTVEVEALVAILAGSAGVEDIDTVALMTWIDAELAAESGQSTSALAIGAAVEAAQETYLAVAGHADAAASEAASIEAWSELAVTLDAATSEAEADEAWATFIAEAGASLEAALGIDSQTQADAVAAAGMVLTSSLSGAGEARLEAMRIAAELTARADLAAQLDAVAGSENETTLRARLEAAYQAFFAAAGGAGDEDELASAWESLALSLTGSAEVTASSVLGLLVSAEEDSQTEAGQAIAATAEAAARLQTRLEVALSGEAGARAEAIAEAYADFRAEVSAVIAATAELSARVQAFAESAATQIGGHGAVLLDIDVRGILGGVVGAELDLDIAAQVLVAAAEEGVAVDEELLEVLIDGNVAASADGADDVHTLALAIGAATAVSAQAEDEARAHLEAALVFQAVIESMTGADSELSEASEARVVIESAFALEAALHAAFEGSAWADQGDEVSAAVSALIEATVNATSASQVDLAAEAFVDAILEIGGEGQGVTALTGDVNAMVGVAFAAAATWETTIEGTIASAGDNLDVGVLASAAATASATFDAAIDVTALLGGADAEAMTALLTHLSLGFHHY